MFNVGFAELIFILLIAFVIVGPKDLPKVARAIGRWVKYFRRLFQEFQDETGLGETIAELKQGEKEIKETLRAADPTVEIRKTQADVQKVIRDAQKAVDGGK